MKRRSFLKSVLKALVIIPVIGLVPDEKLIIPYPDRVYKFNDDDLHFVGSNDYIEFNGVDDYIWLPLTPPVKAKPDKGGY